MSFYDYDDYYDYNPEIAKAKKKNEKLVGQLKNFRKNALGLGTNKIKRRLNVLTSDNAKIVRLMLEIEDKNIQAKDTYGSYRETIYFHKKELIEQLLSIYVERETLDYGIHQSNVRDTNYIIFFELDDGTQISWHTDLKSNKVKKYDKKWDGKVNSTLPKLFKYIENNFKEIIY